MLQSFLYNIDDKKVSENNEINYSLTLNCGSEIYQAHFPGTPITPGACLMEIVREVLEDHFKAKVKLTKMKSVKFLIPIIPQQINNIDIILTGDSPFYETNSSCKGVGVIIRDRKENTICVKMNLLFQIES